MPESCFKLMQISEDGSDIKLLDMQNKMPDISLEEGSYAGFTEFTFSGDRIYGVKEYYSLADVETMGDAEAVKSALCCWDFSGNMIWEQMLAPAGEDGIEVHVRSILPDDNSSINLIFSGDDFMIQGHSCVADGESMADVVYATMNGVYSVNMGDTESNQIMSFVNSDVPTINMNHIVILDETRFVGFYYDSYKYSQVVSLFTKRNPEYRIVMKEYHTYDTMENGMAGYNRLNMDILGRGLPDILIADSYFPVSSYISKGLVADIDTLIRADEELSQTEFLENVFDAYRIEGKLYYVTPSFSVNTLIGISDSRLLPKSVRL